MKPFIGLLFYFFSIFHFFNNFSFFHFSFFHFLSFSFIFFNLLSFSLSLLGAQNLIFLGLNFVTLTRDSSHVKNQFLGPSWVVGTPLGPLFLFFQLFFCPVDLFFLALYFSCFLIFCSFRHFDKFF